MTPADLQDAKPQPRKGEKAPDLHPDLLRLCAAYDRLRAAQAACDDHDPPYAGDLWGAKTRAYTEAKADLAAEFDRIKGATA